MMPDMNLFEIFILKISVVLFGVGKKR